MSVRYTASPLLAAAALAAVALAGCRIDLGPVDRALGRMVRQARTNPYRASPVFADGMAMRTPPAGTVARDATLPAADSVAPAATPELVALGRARFGVFCAVCHGAAGDGRSVVASNMDPPKPPSLRSARVRGLPVAQLYAVIARGFGRMPSYAAELEPRERWAVIAYLRTLGPDSAAVGPPAPSAGVASGAGR